MCVCVCVCVCACVHARFLVSQLLRDLKTLSRKTIQQHICEEKSREKDIFLLGMLTTGQHKEEIADARHSASATPRDCTTLLYTVNGRKVCRSVICAVCGAGRTPLN